MSLYSDIVEVVVIGEEVCRARAELAGDPRGDWGGSVRAADGASEAPKGLERSTRWVLRTPEGLEATVESGGYVMDSSVGLPGGLHPWSTQVDGVGEFPPLDRALFPK
jgi:hypothetical protein